MPQVVLYLLKLRAGGRQKVGASLVFQLADKQLLVDDPFLRLGNVPAGHLKQRLPLAHAMLMDRIGFILQ